MDAAPPAIADRMARAIGSAPDRIRAATTARITTPIAGTAASPATGAVRGVIAATRPITAACPMAAGKPEPSLAPRVACTPPARRDVFHDHRCERAGLRVQRKSLTDLEEVGFRVRP